MNLYIVSCAEWDYDEFDSFVIAAESEEEAVDIATDRAYNFKQHVEEVEVELIADDCLYIESGIIHKSFNAG